MQVHNVLMIYFAKSESALKPKNKYVEILAYVQTAVIVVLVLAQLFFLEDFLKIFTDFELFTDPQAYFIGSFIIWAEVFSIPFLLGMKLSKAFRVFCMLLLWLVTIFWIFLSIWLPFDGRDSGLLGGFVVVSSGLPIVVFSILFGGMSINNIWGLWPLDRKRQSKRK
jgi:hypothetical protein